MIKPKRLQSGMTVGVVAPASAPYEPETVRFAADIVRSLGFEARLGAHVFDRHGYLAGTDADRADDVNRMFADEAIDAIICLRGGYGASRLLPLLDYGLIRSHPKAFVGYSDITALHMGIARHAGLVTFHGPTAGAEWGEYTVTEFKKVLFGSEWPDVIGAPPPFESREGAAERDNRLTPLVAGKARGRLMGGNLSLTTHLCGTPYQPDFSGAILYLEDVGEAHYAIDRYLTQLWLAGVFHAVAGVAFGKFTDPGDSTWLHDRPLEDILGERCKALGLPAIMGLMIGHVDNQTTVPNGCMAELDVDAGTLTLLESPVE